VARRERRIDELHRDVVVRAGVGEGGVRGVRQLGGVVHGVRRPRQAAVYADETCNRAGPLNFVVLQSVHGRTWTWSWSGGVLSSSVHRAGGYGTL